MSLSNSSEITIRLSQPQIFSMGSTESCLMVKKHARTRFPKFYFMGQQGSLANVNQFTNIIEILHITSFLLQLLNASVHTHTCTQKHEACTPFDCLNPILIENALVCYFFMWLPGNHHRALSETPGRALPPLTPPDHDPCGPLVAGLCRLTSQ